MTFTAPSRSLGWRPITPLGRSVSGRGVDGLKCTPTPNIRKMNRDDGLQVALGAGLALLAAFSWATGHSESALIVGVLALVALATNALRLVVRSCWVFSPHAQLRS